MTARIKNSVSKLVSTIEQVTKGPSSRTLPSSIKSLRIQYHGLKNNAGARHWAKESLPSLKHFNSNVEITVVPKISKKGKEVETISTITTVEDSTAIMTESWKAPPGIFIGFHGETKEAFFPLTPARSETLVKRFFDTIDSPEALEALLNGKGLQIEEQSNQRREDTSTTSTSDDAVVNGDGEVVEPEMILEGITEAQVKEKNL